MNWYAANQLIWETVIKKFHYVTLTNVNESVRNFGSWPFINLYKGCTNDNKNYAYYKTQVTDFRTSKEVTTGSYQQT